MELVVDLKEFSRRGAFCAAPVGGAGAAGGGATGLGPFGGTTELFGGITFAEAAPLTLAFVGFIAVGMWMFRRFGGAPEAPVEEPLVEVAEIPEEERERELINA